MVIRVVSKEKSKIMGVVLCSYVSLETYKAVVEKARSMNKSVSAYVREVLEKEIWGKNS